MVRHSVTPFSVPKSGYIVHHDEIGNRQSAIVTVNWLKTNLQENYMDWRVFVTTFGVIFLAEMGDKTQLAAMTMAAQTKNPWGVFLGAALALTAVSAIGVVVGSALGAYLPLVWIKRVAAAAFILIGILILLEKF
ncbi:MAG TPA: TMEM165/GDT1 family protein [Pyrinomonadaceae bacterium]|nr:TMEM165/GDT1 family protein [Pyrinomonadaceae bacterium]